MRLARLARLARHPRYLRLLRLATLVPRALVRVALVRGSAFAANPSVLFLLVRKPTWLSATDDIRKFFLLLDFPGTRDDWLACQRQLSCLGTVV